MNINKNSENIIPPYLGDSTPQTIMTPRTENRDKKSVPQSFNSTITDKSITRPSSPPTYPGLINPDRRKSSLPQGFTPNVTRPSSPPGYPEFVSPPLYSPPPARKSSYYNKNIENENNENNIQSNTNNSPLNISSKTILMNNINNNLASDDMFSPGEMMTVQDLSPMYKKKIKKMISSDSLESLLGPGSEGK
jgi:hypothetical protein